MRRIGMLVCAGALLGLAQLPAVGQDKKEPPKIIDRAAVQSCCAPAGHSYRFLDGRPLVIVANGVGGSTIASDNLLDVNSEMNLGLRIQAVSWTRHNAVFKDLVDTEAQINAAGRIACNITAIRRDCPNLPIHLVGHSAGARVVLAAAEMLPPKSIERIIVLSPAVSCSYDLTGALRASRCGIDNFWSADDTALDHAVDHVGTADRRKGPAAGYRGFRLPSDDPETVAAYRNLHQIRWKEDYCGSGGHNVWVIRHNLKRVVVPVFFMGAVVYEPPTWQSPPPEVRKMPPAK